MSATKKSLIVIVCAVVLSTLGIQASDTLRGINNNLSGLVSKSSGPCNQGETQMLLGSQSLCVDVFEASAAGNCPYPNPSNQAETQDNLNSVSCVAASQPNVDPWRFVSLTQAQQLCARSSKRLPTNEEWYKFASGIPDQSACVVNNKSKHELTGSAGCVTPAGIHDVVGNVWEWIDEEVTNGNFNSRNLPPSGYVSLVDSDGIVIETSSAAVEEYGKDYAWTKPEGVYGVIRGGYYGGEEDAGIFAQNLSVPLDFKTAGVGFRCVRDI